jgi:hypothetical protein
MRSNDLAALLVQRQPTGVGFRQGVVLAWNPDTAQNTVDVGGVVLTDVPILNTSESRLLTPGAVVGILTAGSSWMILGRVTVPNTPDAASALAMISQRIVAASDPAQGTRSSSSFGDLTGAAVGPSVTVTISSVGRAALVFWSAGYGEPDDLSWQPRSTAGISVEVSGATSIAASGDYSLGHNMQFPEAPNPGNALTFSSFQNSLMHLFTGLNPGSTNFTMKYRNLAGTTDCRFETREIAVFAL